MARLRNTFTQPNAQQVRDGRRHVDVLNLVELARRLHAITAGDEKAFGDGKTLVAVRFHVKNATTLKQFLDTSGGKLTSLTDDDEHSYTSIDLDGKRDSELLPGAACDWILFYQVPKSYKRGDMVYQLHSYTVEHGYKDYTFRISLKQTDKL